MKVRRVVTGHDTNAKAVVLLDEIIDDPKSGRPGALVAPIWISEGFPVDNNGDEDTARRKAAPVVTDGTAFRVIEFKPSVQARNHRTNSLDYAIVMSGEIDMEMDGTTVHLKAGDVLVQRGTIHNWINRGTEACVMAVILIHAKSAEAGGQLLTPAG